MYTAWGAGAYNTLESVSRKGSHTAHAGSRSEDRSTPAEAAAAATAAAEAPLDAAAAAAEAAALLAVKHTKQWLQLCVDTG